MIDNQRNFEFVAAVARTAERPHKQRQPLRNRRRRSGPSGVQGLSRSRRIGRHARVGSALRRVDRNKGGPLLADPRVQSFGVRLRLHAEFASEGVAADVVLLQGEVDAALRRIGAHEGPMDVFAERVQRQQARCRRHAATEILYLDIVRDQPFQRGDGHCAKALALRAGPFLERLFIQAEAVE
jgi:hypothetical protein